MRRNLVTLSIALMVFFCTVMPARANDTSTESLAAAFVAKVLGSALFVSDRGQDDALAESVYPYFPILGFEQNDLTQLQVDREKKEVRAAMKNGPLRTARYFGDQGCVIIPMGADGVHFEPVKLSKDLPAASTPWPLGVAIEVSDLPEGIDKAKLDEGVEKMFDPRAHSAALVVLYKGRIIAERYGAGADMHTPLESWSMGKTLTAVLYGLLAHQEGNWNPDRAAGFAEWQDDSRRDITVGHLLRMSSGLKFSARADDPSTWAQGFPDHTYVYSGAIDAFNFSLTRPAEHEPNTVGRYRNCDPLLIGLLIKRAVESRGEGYLSFPQHALFDKLGMRNMVLETDPHGNFLLTGYDYGSARDWARLGLLLAQDGVWMGERILPEGFVEFMTTPAPAWEKPEYGGLVWLGDDWTGWYRASGNGGQKVNVIPEHDLVIVRLGHFAGYEHAGTAFYRATPLIIESLPD